MMLKLTTLSRLPAESRLMRAESRLPAETGVCEAYSPSNRGVVGFRRLMVGAHAASASARRTKRERRGTVPLVLVKAWKIIEGRAKSARIVLAGGLLREELGRGGIRQPLRLQIPV